jgi:choline kinase
MMTDDSVGDRHIQVTGIVIQDAMTRTNATRLHHLRQRLDIDQPALGKHSALLDAGLVDEQGCARRHLQHPTQQPVLIAQAASAQSSSAEDKQLAIEQGRGVTASARCICLLVGAWRP